MSTIKITGLEGGRVKLTSEQFDDLTSRFNGRSLRLGDDTSLFTATLDDLGAVGDGAHARHEFVYVEKLVEQSALLALLLMEPPREKGDDT